MTSELREKLLAAILDAEVRTVWAREAKENTKPSTSSLPSGIELIAADNPAIFAEEPKKEGLDYYGGFATLEEMISSFGKSTARDWCLLTAFKYMSRIGKKPGAEIGSDAQKAKDYIVLGMRLTRELEEK